MTWFAYAALGFVALLVVLAVFAVLDIGHGDWWFDDQDHR